MKKTFTKIQGFAMFALTLALGIVDASGMLAAATVIPQGSNNGAPKSGVGLVGANDGNMSEGQIRGLVADKTNGDIGDFYDDSVDSEIVKFRPDLSPLDTITRQMKAKKAETMRFNWYSVDLLPHTTTLAQGTIATAYTMTVADHKCIHEGDTIKVVAEDGAEYFYYVDKKANEVLTVTPPYDSEIIAKPAMDVIAAGATIYVCGNAAAEGDMTTSAYGIVPTKENNFCQIFKCQVSESTINKLSRKDINWGLSDVEEQAIYQWRNKIEMSALFGTKGFFMPEDKNASVYTTNGLVKYIKKNLELGKAVDAQGNVILTNADLVDLTKEIFVGNSGSQQRVMFAGSGFVAALSKIEAIQKQQEAGNTVVVWGIEWKEIRTNFGTLLLQHHKGLDLYGYTDKAIVLDMQYVDKWTFKPLERVEIDTRKAGTYDGDTYVSTEICGFSLRYPDCHAIVSLKA
jgi:hypothetical protein